MGFCSTKSDGFYESCPRLIEDTALTVCMWNLKTLELMSFEFFMKHEIGEFF